MAESITITPNDPPLKSMDYALLREAGLQHIQRLSGKIWSDNNAHDPGITMLEVLAYAITDLGYRTNYDIKDILTPDPVTADIRNFFTAAQILPNSPVTLNDYRKLMMDVECEEEILPGETLRFGVRNAWITKGIAECPVYANYETGTLQYTPPSPDAVPLDLRPLYDVLVEFDTLDEDYGGDLNENSIEGQLVLVGQPTNSVGGGPNLPFLGLEGTVIDYVIEFPRWDTPGIEWYACDPEDTGIPGNIKQNSVNITLKFSRLSDEITVEDYGLLSPDKDFWISLNKRDATLSSPTMQQIADANAYVQDQLNKVLFYSTTVQTAIRKYQAKVMRVQKIIRKVRETLMENRNLCEDFIRINAVKVEEIALCADIETLPEADLEEINAQIYHQIARFLDPTVYFYTLDEMFAKGKTTDEIFDGPLLKHGFIIEDELTYAERRDVIHVSDLISIIMDIPGVTAVKSIQIANVPLDNDDNIVSKAVRWCLEIAVALNYVPRLSIERSTLTFYKENLPMRANQVEVKERIDELEANERPQKQHDIPLDLPVPTGEFKDIENYYSIQEEFPLLYGIGSPGLPQSASAMRKAQAKQLKAFLLFFDQLLGNYLSQLFHVKDLFSMNDAVDPVTGDPVINKTYFSQSLLSIVPDAAPLYFETNPVDNAEQLQAITEDPDTYLNRRNRVLDHLAARFAESFNDYALLVYSLDGKKAPAELIADKLAFLNNYPQISSERDKGMNYMDPCELWHVDNISGLERRSSFLAGFDRPLEENLVFSTGFDYQVPSGSGYTFQIYDGTYYLTGVSTYATREESRLALERAIVTASQVERYVIRDASGTVAYSANGCLLTEYYAYLLCGDADFAVISSLPNVPAVPEDLSDFDNAMTVAGQLAAFAQQELLYNAESNRYNFACIFLKYVLGLGDPVINMHDDPGDACPPDYQYTFDLSCSLPDVLMSGVVHGQAVKGDVLSVVEEKAELNRDRLIFEFFSQAKTAANYKFAYNGPVEEARLLDKCGNEIGTLTETDFGAGILGDLNGLVTATENVVIEDSTDYDGSYPIVSAAMHLVNPQWINIGITATLNPPTRVDGTVFYSLKNTNILALDQSARTFDLDRDLSRIVFPGDTVYLSGFSPASGNNTDFSVIKVVKTGPSASQLYVKQAIPDAMSGAPELMYTKNLVIVNVDATSSILTVAHAADVLAVKEASDCITRRFFSHEGMHIIEHILLRPCCNKSVWQTISPENGNQLVKSFSGDGVITYVIQYDNVTYDAPKQNIFVRDVNLVNYLFPGATIKLASDDGLIIFQAMVRKVSYNSTSRISTIEVNKVIPDVTASNYLQFQIKQIINSVDSDRNKFVVDNLFGEVAMEYVLTVKGSKVGNDGVYRKTKGGSPGNPFGIVVQDRLASACEDFLPILINDPCLDCNYTDPYSFIATVILPSWQGRFENQPFRRFFERTLRMECPAHVLLNICWVDCSEMEEFEIKYKTWLLEHARVNRDTVAHARALNELIEVLLRLRSDFPRGTLHDCENTEDFSNSIILNNSIIGTL